MENFHTHISLQSRTGLSRKCGCPSCRECHSEDERCRYRATWISAKSWKKPQKPKKIVWVCLPLVLKFVFYWSGLFVSFCWSVICGCTVLYIIACDHSFQYKISTLMRSTDNFFDVKSSRPTFLFQGE